MPFKCVSFTDISSDCIFNKEKDEETNGWRQLTKI